MQIKMHFNSVIRSSIRPHIVVMDIGTLDRDKTLMDQCALLYAKKAGLINWLITD